MKLSHKARALIMRAYTSNRPVATISEDIEREMIASRLMRYDTKPLMVLTHDGKVYCKKRGENRDG